jgi:spore maturation protein CgeB
MADSAPEENGNDRPGAGRTAMRVMLLGNLTFFHVGAFFKRALECLGYPHVALDFTSCERPGWPSLARKAAYRLLWRRPPGYWQFNRQVVATARDFVPDVVLVTMGSVVRPAALRAIKAATGAVLVNFATDDPFNPRSNPRRVVASIQLYDLYACTKTAIMGGVRAAGCRNAVYVPFGYEPSLHFPGLFDSAEERKRFSSDVVFIGSGDSDRYPYFEALVDRIPGLRLRLHSPYWDNNPRLRPYARGQALGRDYRLAVAGAKIAPCLVRQANRDGHVMRSFEVPACGGFMLAQRTPEHERLFEEGKEVGYFSSPAELVDKVRYYLAHESERRRMARAAHLKVTTGKHTYLDRLQQVLAYASSLRANRARILNPSRPECRAADNGALASNLAC